MGLRTDLRRSREVHMLCRHGKELGNEVSNDYVEKESRVHVPGAVGRHRLPDVHTSWNGWAGKMGVAGRPYIVYVCREWTDPSERSISKRKKEKDSNTYLPSDGHCIRGESICCVET